MGSDESHFNVSVGSDGQRHKTVSTDHNLFEEKGEPKRYRTEVLSLTSLTPYRQSGCNDTYFTTDLHLVLITGRVVWKFLDLNVPATT